MVEPRIALTTAAATVQSRVGSAWSCGVGCATIGGGGGSDGDDGGNGSAHGGDSTCAATVSGFPYILGTRIANLQASGSAGHQ